MRRALYIEISSTVRVLKYKTCALLISTFNTVTRINFQKKLASPLATYLNEQYIQVHTAFANFLCRQDVETKNAQRFCLEQQIHTVLVSDFSI